MGDPFCFYESPFLGVPGGIRTHCLPLRRRDCWIHETLDISRVFGLSFEQKFEFTTKFTTIQITYVINVIWYLKMGCILTPPGRKYGVFT